MVVLYLWFGLYELVWSYYGHMDSICGFGSYMHLLWIIVLWIKCYLCIELWLLWIMLLVMIKCYICIELCCWIIVLWIICYMVEFEMLAKIEKGWKKIYTGKETLPCVYTWQRCHASQYCAPGAHLVTKWSLCRVLPQDARQRVDDLRAPGLSLPCMVTWQRGHGRGRCTAEGPRTAERGAQQSEDARQSTEPLL
jgi:hypothetical protein